MKKQGELSRMDDHQLLVMIAENAVKTNRYRKVTMWAVIVIAAAVVVSLILVIPEVLNVLSNVNGVDFAGLNQAIQNLQDAAQNLSNITSIFGN